MTRCPGYGGVSVVLLLGFLLGPLDCVCLDEAAISLGDLPHQELRQSRDLLQSPYLVCGEPASLNGIRPGLGIATDMRREKRDVDVPAVRWEFAKIDYAKDLGIYPCHFKDLPSDGVPSSLVRLHVATRDAPETLLGIDPASDKQEEVIFEYNPTDTCHRYTTSASRT